MQVAVVAVALAVGRKMSFKIVSAAELDVNVAFVVTKEDPPPLLLFFLSLLAIPRVAAGVAWLEFSVNPVPLSVCFPPLPLPVEFVTLVLTFELRGLFTKWPSK